MSRQDDPDPPARPRHKEEEVHETLSSAFGRWEPPEEDPFDHLFTAASSRDPSSDPAPPPDPAPPLRGHRRSLLGFRPSRPAADPPRRTISPDPPADAPPKDPYADIGGLQGPLARVRELIELPLRHPEVFRRLGIDPPRGVLLHGPPGCGKTLIGRTLARVAQASFFSISGPEIVNKWYGESEALLRMRFEEAEGHAPAILFIDELDSIAPARANVHGQVEKRMVAQLLTLMDGLTARTGVVVLGATNLPDALDPALRRPGRFDREIAVPAPDQAGRLQILRVHTRAMPLDPDVDLPALAARTHGFVGADLAGLCREAALSCLRRHEPELILAHIAATLADRQRRQRERTREVLDEARSLRARLRDSLNDEPPSRSRHSDTPGDGPGDTVPLPDEALECLLVTADDFQAARAEVGPSLLRAARVEVPQVRFSDIGGLDEVKRALIEAVVWPQRHAAVLAAARVRPPRGILLSGPPGCGKTLLARAAATEGGVNFIPVRGPELLTKWIGESERAVRELFRTARGAAPCILCFDELDALAGTRSASGAHDGGVSDRVIGQLLTELDGIEDLPGVLVLGTTNRPDRIDPALLRPGRFDQVLHLGPPDRAARAAILRVHLRRRPLAADVDPARLAVLTEGLSGAELSGLCERAALAAVRRAVLSGQPPQVEVSDLLAAIG